MTKDIENAMVLPHADDEPEYQWPESEFEKDLDSKKWDKIVADMLKDELLRITRVQK